MTPALAATGPRASAAGRVAARVEVTGVVQGVGYRPFVHRVATALGLDGTVGNDTTRVFIEVAGPEAAVDRLVDTLRSEAPPSARVDEVRRLDASGPVSTASGFRIVESRAAAGAPTLVPPDTATCPACVRELFDPTDRRHHHPFISCTDCGPRFTIITAMPYDRPSTTMAGFAMCPRCRAEYDDPADRRHHAQPVACPDCGPTLTWRAPDGRRDGHEGAVGTDAIAEAAALLDEGGVVAIKGLGGYHLAVDAIDADAVARLRERKHRPDKPLAVLVADLDRAAELADIGPAEADLLASPAAPIVLVRARPDSPLPGVVAPGNPLIGLLLPYTPVHHLLMAAHPGPLVLTSANRSGRPLATDRAAIDALADVHDGVLDHDRPIQVPCDDSVVRVVDDHLLPIRRARGYAPIPVAVPTMPRPVLAVGADLKNTVCLAAGDRAWVSQHIGDHGELATLDTLDAVVDGLQRMYGVDDPLVAADLHPGYVTSGWARRRTAPAGPLGVQHHHAHVAAVLAEHGEDPTRPVLGFAFDGTGYGHDGAIWGGEVLVADARRADRAAHLAPVPLPGGDGAIVNPHRVALAHLWAAGIDWSPDLAPVGEPTAAELDLLRRQLETGTACVATTSMGRLFDAVASLVGLRHRISYEAQAAIELELAAERAEDTIAGGAAGGGADDAYRFAIRRPAEAGAPSPGPEGGPATPGAAVATSGSATVARPAVADPAPVLEAIVADLATGVDAGTIALRFHRAVAALVADLARDLAAAHGLETVALSGGVFQNALLVRLCRAELAPTGLRLLTHRLVPPNDGGLALGQAIIAAHRLDEPPTISGQSTGGRPTRDQPTPDRRPKEH